MKSIVYILVCLTFPGCAINYPLTTFYVKNNSDKTINFKASILKYSTMGAFEMMLPFTVLPKDSVIARRAKFRKNISPNEWFMQFIIFPVDSVLLNDPKIPSNWIKSTDPKGRIVYSFNLAQ
jgi:hypothetical protein